MNDNNEGCSKLKHTIKEHVKEILSENKQVISLSFAALIQTLKTNPPISNLIYNMFTTPDDCGYDNNNDNNIIKYPELNKTRILDLSEKNYENVVEALTNDSIANASSNPTLALHLSLSTFSNLSNQNDRYRIEESDGFHDSKSDIAG